MSKAVVVLLALGVACGAAEPPVAQDPTSTTDPSEPAGAEGDESVSDENDENDANDAHDANDEDDAMHCASDDDCVSGGPARCCTSSGPDCARAWSRTAWEAFQASCAVRDCDRDVMLACPEREGPPPTAVCVDARCVLR